MTDKVYHELNANDFIVRLSPFLDQNGDWTGELNVGVSTMDDNSMSDDDYFYLMQLAQMLSAAVPLLEEDDNFRNRLYRYMNSVVEDKTDGKPSVKSEGNVINLAF